MVLITVAVGLEALFDLTVLVIVVVVVVTLLSLFLVVVAFVPPVEFFIVAMIDLVVLCKSTSRNFVKGRGIDGKDNNISLPIRTSK